MREAARHREERRECTWENYQVRSEIFDFEYWPLELFKLQSAPPPGEFSGHVAIITGASDPLGRAVATRLAREGAHLVFTGDEADVLRDIAAASPGTVLIAANDPVSAAIATFGGVDILVALAPSAKSEIDRLGAATNHTTLPVGG